MLDGIIAAFHGYCGEKLIEVSRRLSSVLPDKTEEIAAMLLDEKTNVLGSRCLVHPFRDFVQWNPADDKCVVIKLVKNFADQKQITMAGRLFAVESALDI